MKIERKQIHFYMAFSLPSPVPIRGSYSNDDGECNVNDKKALYISLPSLHDYDAKRPIIISRSMVDVNKRQRFSFSFRELR